MTEDVLIRHHEVSRQNLFTFDEEAPPFDLRYVDVFRLTKTDLDAAAEARIEDDWVNGGTRELSDWWTGSTTFNLLKPEAPKGHTWVNGRPTPTRINKDTTRPPTVLPEAWKGTPKAQRLPEIAKWEERRPSIHSARRTLGREECGNLTPMLPSSETEE